MTDEAPTPRTNEFIRTTTSAFRDWHDFARELERETIRLRSENAELRAEVVNISELHAESQHLIDRYRAVLVELVAAWDEANAWDDPRINDAVVAARALTAKGEKG